MARILTTEGVWCDLEMKSPSRGQLYLRDCFCNDRVVHFFPGGRWVKPCYHVGVLSLILAAPFFGLPVGAGMAVLAFPLGVLALCTDVGLTLWAWPCSNLFDATAVVGRWLRIREARGLAEREQVAQAQEILSALVAAQKEVMQMDRSRIG